MRNKNSATMIGRVRLKSKSAAFSISTDREGGARVSEVAATRDRDLSVEVESLRSWCFVIFGVGSLGSVIWDMESLGFGVVESEGVGGVKVLVEAMIMLAMPAYCFTVTDMSLFVLLGERECVFVYCVIWLVSEKDVWGERGVEGYLILCHTN